MGASIEKTFLPPFRYSEQFYYFFNVNNIGMYAVAVPSEISKTIAQAYSIWS